MQNPFASRLGWLGLGLSTIWYVIRVLYWFIEKAGDADFVLSKRDTIMSIITAWWFPLALTLVGLAIILLAALRNRRLPDGSNQEESTGDNISEAERQELIRIRENTERLFYTDKLKNVIVQGHRRDYLDVHKGYTPWRVWYPLHLFNGSDVRMEIVGYNFNLLLNDSEIKRIQWRAPEPEASNGIPLKPNIETWEAYTIEAGQPYTLPVPINRRDLTDLPRDNPRWGSRGSIYLRCNGQERRLPFDFSTDHYQLDSSDWVMWASQ